MNWVGGVRNRLKAKSERKRQQEFFEKQKFSSRVKRLESSTTGSPSKRKQAVSLDILALQAANYSATKFQKHDSVSKKAGRVQHVDIGKSRGPFSHTFVDLPDGSPDIKPSGLALDMPSPFSSEHQQTDKQVMGRPPSPTLSGLRPNTRIPEVRDGSDWHSSAKRPRHQCNTPGYWTSTPRDPWLTGTNLDPQHDPPVGLYSSCRDSMSSFKDFKMKKEAEFTHHATAEKEGLFTHHATAENLLLHGMRDRERQMETIEEESHWSSPRISHGSVTSGISGMSPYSVATDTSEEAPAPSLEHHGWGSPADNPTIQNYIPEIPLLKAESQPAPKVSSPVPSSGETACLPQDSSLSSFKDYHRITAAREPTQTVHHTITSSQTLVEKLAPERDRNSTERPAPARGLSKGLDGFQSQSHMQQQHPASLEEKDLTCEESATFTSPEDLADAAERPYLMKNTARNIQTMAMQQDIQTDSIENQQEKINSECAEIKSSTQVPRKWLDHPGYRVLQKKRNTNTNVDISKPYSAHERWQLTPTAKEGITLSNTSLPLCKSASGQRELKPASTQSQQTPALQYRNQSCQEVAQAIDACQENEAPSSIKVASAMPVPNQLVIGKDASANSEDSCSSCEDDEDDPDADSGQSSDEIESVCDSDEDGVATAATQVQKPGLTTECNWLGFVTGTTASQPFNEHPPSKKKLDIKLSPSNVQTKICASVTAQQMLQEVLALDKELQIDESASTSGEDGQNRQPMLIVVKERGLEQMSGWCEPNIGQTVGDMSPLEIKQSMISPAYSTGSSLINTAEVNTCMKSPGDGTKDISNVPKDTIHTQDDAETKMKATMQEQNISETKTIQPSRRGEELTTLHIDIQGVQYVNSYTPGEKNQRANRGEVSLMESPSVKVTDRKALGSSIAPNDSFSHKGDSNAITANEGSEHKRQKANKGTFLSMVSPSVKVTQNCKFMESSIKQKDSYTHTGNSHAIADDVSEHSFKSLTPAALPTKATNDKMETSVAQKDTSTQTNEVDTVSCEGTLGSSARNVLSPAIPTSTSSESSPVCDGSVQCMLIGEPLPVPQHHPLDTERIDVQKPMCDKESTSALAPAKGTFCDSTISSQDDAYLSCNSTED